MNAEKVALVVPYCFVPPRNGGHKAAFGFSEALSRRLPFICLSTDDNQASQAPFRLAPVFEARITKYISPIAAWRCYQVLKSEKVTACIAFQPFIALLLWPVSSLLGIPLDIYAQNLEYQRFRSMRRWFWPVLFVVEWLAFRLARRLYFISPDDLPLAVKAFRLPSGKCRVAPYGTPYRSQPGNRAQKRRVIREKHGFGESDFLIIFFGPQTYRPNLEAVELIVNNINPVLRKKAAFSYRFLICGGGLPDSFNRLETYPNVDYLGYVEDIEAYVQAADVMINPAITGGGVKTKLIEALALGTPVVSSRSGALGVDAAACGAKLVAVDDNDYEAYCDALARIQASPGPPTPASFYDLYFWDHAIRPVLEG
ncbi:MAG: glycosyltransferase family 4 protein [Lewinellaceae bacterium]|nr:glycosyltransferase family 4 protein [Lewinellaceae bacterium]